MANDAQHRKVVHHGESMVIWLSGNLSEGFRAFGPYSSMDEAFDAHDGQDGWAMTMTKNDSSNG